MRRSIPMLIAAGLLATTLGIPSAAVRAADLGAGAAVDQPVEQGDLATALSRYADLLAIRVTFDVLDADEVDPELRAAAKRWGKAGPGAGEAAQIDNALLGEGSYYLTSIAYVIKADGAAFPSDRAYSAYGNDALVKLDALRDRLISAVGAGEPVHDIFVEAQSLRWLTEGLKAVPADQDRLADHDKLVAAALAAAGGVGV